VPGLTVSLGWACSLAPDAVTNYAPLFGVVTGALAGQTNITKNLYGFQTLGALLYRARRYPEAARQLTETYQLSQAGNTNTTTPLTACGAYFLTLTHAQLGHTNEAIACFQRASRLDASARGTGGRGAADIPPWDERLNLQLLRKEAESVLNARAPQPTPPP
jgi:hypothetical protein